MTTTRTKLPRIVSIFSNNFKKWNPPTRFGSCSGVLSRNASTSTAAEPDVAGLEMFGAKDYVDYRKSLYGDITHKALLVDAVGTLLIPSQPMAQVLFYCNLAIFLSWR